MNAPIIFCHFSPSSYLNYVFEAVRLTNPDHEIFLLGDESNRQIAAKYSLKHLYFTEFDYGEKIALFNQVYQLIEGRNHHGIRGTTDWVNFIFKRWFYVYNFTTSSGYEKFWHFDSDTMILTNLSQHEDKFKNYDSTEQCNGMCINGFINSLNSVESYLDKINNLFQDQEYLAGLRKLFDEVYPDYAFTEMSAYLEFKKEPVINTIRLNTVINNSTFDDCMCYKHELETERLFTGREVKKIYTNGSGYFYGYHEELKQIVTINSLNLSWLPIEFFAIVLKELKKREFESVSAELATLNLKNMTSLGQIFFRECYIKYMRKNLRRKLRNIVKPLLQKVGILSNSHSIT
ncbi:hypothetical protein GlitD10_2596 [Gloeomargarita lithophora Alchichica-D10]|uniref:Uncharacterized protein n=1 Tax=Gloeomargarita lithophora Alchichica-D10 TaxID=1188229 RepID=A0A1J0AG73_9CYAN|nr:hypothetical protein [Gloeomargarita lithophora]APB34937.1 hypothetical protein GlitD10_2596 [Gloeomargarita lithophora Alchichica-D10]